MEQEEEQIDTGSKYTVSGSDQNADYMIHVYIEKGKEFKVPENGTIDPMFVINCLGKRQYS